jgi:hypothetical protein
MRFVTAASIGAFWLACSSAPPFSSRRVAYGTYELTCKLPLGQCLDHVEEICKGLPYEVTSAHDRRTPIDVALAGTQREIRSSDAVVRCELTKPLFGEGPAPASPAPTASPSPAARATAQHCVPGTTQVCVGPAACSGGQACLADGSGFGPCNCGAAPRRADGGAD